MNLDFNILKKSIGKTLKFEVSVILENNNTFTDIFYAVLNEVNVENDYIIVEHFYLLSDENFNQQITSQKRKLVKNKFVINREISLNG